MQNESCLDADLLQQSSRPLPNQSVIAAGQQLSGPLDQPLGRPFRGEHRNQLIGPVACMCQAYEAWQTPQTAQ